jgi:hypothetical protein
MHAMGIDLGDFSGHVNMNDSSSCFLVYCDNVDASLLFFVIISLSFQMVFLFWAYYPKSKGASLIYHKVLAPAFDTFEREISDATQNRKQTQQKAN